MFMKHLSEILDTWSRLAQVCEICSNTINSIQEKNQSLQKEMGRYYMQNILMMRLSWMRFIIIMVRIGILVKMSRVMCIRDIITISQEIQKVALL